MTVYLPHISPPWSMHQSLCFCLDMIFNNVESESLYCSCISHGSEPKPQNIYPEIVINIKQCQNHIPLIFSYHLENLKQEIIYPLLRHYCILLLAFNTLSQKISTHIPLQQFEVPLFFLKCTSFSNSFYIPFVILSTNVIKSNCMAISPNILEITTFHGKI